MGLKLVIAGVAGAVAWFAWAVVREMADQRFGQWDEGTGWRVFAP